MKSETFKIYESDAEDLWFAYHCFAHSVINLEELKEWLYLVIDKNDEIPTYIFDMLDINNRDDFHSFNMSKIKTSSYNSKAIYGIGFLRFDNFEAYNCSKEQALNSLKKHSNIIAKFQFNFPTIEISDLASPSPPTSVNQKLCSLEETYQITLPTSYKEFLSKKDTSINGNCFDFWHSESLDYQQRDIYFLRFDTNQQNIQEQSSNEFVPDNVFLIGESSGADIIALDYSEPQRAEPTVVVILHDETLLDDKLPKYMVAESFSDFLEKTYAYESKYNDDDSLKRTEIFYKQLEIADDLGKVTSECLEAFNEEYHVTLPAMYTDFIGKHNEANLINNKFTFTDVYGKERIETCAFFGFKDSKRHIENNEFLKVSNDKEYGYQGFVAFAKNRNKDLWCFNFSALNTNGEPSIVYVDMDIFEPDEDGDSRYLVSEISESFEDFIKKLSY